MGNPTNAFSVYSNQKRKDSRPVNLGVAAYTTEDAFFFANGPKYFEIICASKDLSDEMTTLAKNLIETEPKYAGQQTESSLFPTESLDESSHIAPYDRCFRLQRARPRVYGQLLC